MQIKYDFLCIAYFRESLIHLNMTMSYDQSIVLESLEERDLDILVKLNMIE